MAEVKKICVACDGRGWIPNEAVIENPRLNEPDHFNCEPCDGDGFIIVEEADT